MKLIALAAFMLLAAPVFAAPTDTPTSQTITLTASQIETERRLAQEVERVNFHRVSLRGFLRLIREKTGVEFVNFDHPLTYDTARGKRLATLGPDTADYAQWYADHMANGPGALRVSGDGRAGTTGGHGTTGAECIGLRSPASARGREGPEDSGRLAARAGNSIASRRIADKGSRSSKAADADL